MTESVGCELYTKCTLLKEYVTLNKQNKLQSEVDMNFSIIRCTCI